MPYRTDLALDEAEHISGQLEGIKKEELSFDGVRITRIKVHSQAGAAQLNKPMGHYVTVETAPLTGYVDHDGTAQIALTKELTDLLPAEGAVLVAGLGNPAITPDALGPQVAQHILASRHLSGELTRSVGLGELRGVSAVATGVLGKTGIETGELLCGLVRQISPAAVVVVDALASTSLQRLGRTIQITDTGIVPGSGVGNARREISQKTLGVPVIAVGVPTVVDAATMTLELTGQEVQQGHHSAGMMVTPREIDTMIQNAAKLVALSLNRALHPTVSTEDLMALVG